MSIKYMLFGVMSVLMSVCFAETNIFDNAKKQLKADTKRTIAQKRIERENQIRAIEAEQNQRRKELGLKYKDLNIPSLAGFKFGVPKNGWRREVFNRDVTNEEVILDVPIRHFTTVHFGYSLKTGLRNKISLLGHLDDVDDGCVKSELQKVKEIVEKKYGIELFEPKNGNRPLGFMAKDGMGYFFDADNYLIMLSAKKSVIYLHWIELSITDRTQKEPVYEWKEIDAGVDSDRF